MVEIGLLNFPPFTNSLFHFLIIVECAKWDKCIIVLGDILKNNDISVA
jgi:hypothetical protein